MSNDFKRGVLLPESTLQQLEAVMPEGVSLEDYIDALLIQSVTRMGIRQQRHRDGRAYLPNRFKSKKPLK